MNVLVIGSGGREHTIVWSLEKSKKVSKIFVCPGNGGTEKIAENINISIDNSELLLDFIKSKNINLVVVGPEGPLVDGIADKLISEGILVFGPQKNVAKLEGSKTFAKEFMKKYNIPTADYKEFSDYDLAWEYLKNANYPIVLKADGLASGKGVIIVDDLEKAQIALDRIMKNRDFGDAGNKLVIEEFLEGEEASILAFVDANTIIPMVGSQDHKSLYDDDKGPNTGGMGTYSPAPIVNQEVMKKIENEILKRFMDGIKKEKMVYRGILFVGLMIKDNNPKVLEFNVRFGDPETQVVLPRLQTDLFEVFNAVVNDNLANINLEWKEENAVCVVVASNGYPDFYEKGVAVNIPEIDDVLIFHAGTTIFENKLVNNGGRVLGITALDKDLKKAREKAYLAIEKIDFVNKYYRKDIAKKAFKFLDK
jgi:phosphoribosylamine---glycine ligase